MKKKIIDTREGLEECVGFLNQQERFAIDLEFDKNRYRYGFNLCLVQIFAGDACIIIDPLAKNIGIEQLFPVIENPAIEKIVYSFGEDLRLFHSLGCFPKNVFDIAIAMRLLNYPPASLATSLLEILDIEISKSAQKSNWFLRPLSDKQMDYAARDVLYLLDMKTILVKEAEEKGVMEWINEENAVIDTLNYSDIDNNSYLKEKDKQGLSEYSFHIFKRLLEFRESKAKDLNRPSYQIIDKEYLRELSERPKQIYRFEKIRGIHKRLKNDDFKEELRVKREESEAEAAALNLSPNEDAYKRLGYEEYQKRKAARMLQDDVKRRVFKPIQALIAQNHGEHVVTYILGNRLMEDLALGKLEQLRAYKRVLIEQYAGELGIDVTPYLG